MVDAGAPIVMPWLSQVSSVVDAWYPGQTSGTSLADVLFGKVDPSGHLPVTFPTSLAAGPGLDAGAVPGRQRDQVAVLGGARCRVPLV